jgi:hypothetical protein
MTPLGHLRHFAQDKKLTGLRYRQRQLTISWNWVDPLQTQRFHVPALGHVQIGYFQPYVANTAKAELSLARLDAFLVSAPHRKLVAEVVGIAYKK